MPNPYCKMYCLQNSDFSSVSFCKSIKHMAFCFGCLLYTCFKWFVMPSLRGYGILVLKLVLHLCLLEMTYVTHACGCAWDSTLEVFQAIMTTPCSLITHYHIVSFLYCCVMWWMGKVSGLWAVQLFDSQLGGYFLFVPTDFGSYPVSMNSINWMGWNYPPPTSSAKVRNAWTFIFSFISHVKSF
jgi:hypothetical protein